MNKIVIAAIFLTIVSILSDVQCRQSSHRETDNQLSKNDVRFPKMDMKRLKPEYRAVVQKLQTFARISANRAQRISKLPQNRKARVAEKFEKKFQKDLRKMQLMTNRLQHTPRSALLTQQVGDTSVLGKLQEFITSINQLPVKVHCLIYDCGVIFSTGAPEPTTSTSSPTPTQTTKGSSEYEDSDDDNDVDEDSF